MGRFRVAPAQLPGPSAPAPHAPRHRARGEAMPLRRVRAARAPQGTSAAAACFVCVPDTSALCSSAGCRCDAYATEFDLEAEEYVPLPKGDVHKRKEVVQASQGAGCGDSRETALLACGPQPLRLPLLPWLGAALLPSASLDSKNAVCSCQGAWPSWYCSEPINARLGLPLP